MVEILAPGDYYGNFHKEYTVPHSLVVGETIHDASNNISDVEEEKNTFCLSRKGV